MHAQALEGTGCIRKEGGGRRGCNINNDILDMHDAVLDVSVTSASAQLPTALYDQERHND